MHFEKLTTRIEIQRISQTAHPISGELVDVVVSTSVVWAEVKQTRGSNSFSSVAGGDVGLGLQRFIIRYRDGIDCNSYRVKDKQGYIWRIVDIPQIINRRQGLELVCQYTGKKQEQGIIDLTSSLLGGVAKE